MHDNYYGGLGFALHLSYFLVLILSLKCQHSGGAISVAEFGTMNVTLPLINNFVKYLFETQLPYAIHLDFECFKLGILLSALSLRLWPAR